MWRDYFEINGEKYYTGTVFIVKYNGRPTEASFVYYDTERFKYVFKINDITFHYPDSWFWDMFIEVTDKKNTYVHLPIVKRKREFDIDGMSVGWTWYITLMLISLIFKDAIGLWVFISIVFFSWRSEKINKEGTYIEW